MSDDVARAVGALGTEEIKIAGKVCTTRALGLRELTEVERECLKVWKRNYLETYRDNLDLFPEAEKSELLQRKVEECAKWDVTQLPLKYVYDSERLKVTPALEAWLSSHFEQPLKASDPKNQLKHMQRLASTVLESGELSEAEYTKLTEDTPKKIKVGYVNWWITGSYDGMIAFIWVAFRHNGVTKDEVAGELGSNLPMLVHLAREIEHMTAPAVGNT